MGEEGLGRRLGHSVATAWIALRAAVYTSGFVVLWGWVALLFRPYDQRLGIALPPWAVPAGWVLMAAGAALAASCIGTFVVRGRGTPAPFDAPRQFVAVGPYRVVRNPMYLAGLCILIAYGLVERSGSIVLFAGAWILLVHLAVVTLEEPDLRRKFGTAYADYCRAVPRWLPSLRRR
ncbi:MAG TPA: isoprenylcysteine carboxylmethyltransferase family protein [Thermoanaerobaculia bacterium]|nr:isoprenylcysteine carboxylmethyltransferase family protein [Thermoanaerobaculia bacterium]